MFAKALKLIETFDTVIIHRHSNPDGDAIGSQVGLKSILKENFPNKTVYAVGDAAGRYSFVEGSSMDEIADSLYENALSIVLDTSAKHLISDDRYLSAKATLRFDHHLFVEKICDEEVVDTSKESCASLIAAFARDTGLKVNLLAATALYTGMVTDSGRFRYDSVNAETFRLAAFLMEQPIDTGAIFRELYADDFDYVRLKASFILKIKFTPKNTAYIYTTLPEFLETGKSSFTISRGMVATMADLKGVSVWVNFTETEDGVLCEVRSNKYNINQVAVKYGGGGHLKASGALLKNKDEAMAFLADLDLLYDQE